MYYTNCLVIEEFTKSKDSQKMRNSSKDHPILSIMRFHLGSESYLKIPQNIPNNILTNSSADNNDHQSHQCLSDSYNPRFFPLELLMSHTTNFPSKKILNPLI